LTADERGWNRVIAGIARNRRNRKGNTSPLVNADNTDPNNSGFS